MSILLGDDDSLLGSTPSGSENNYSSQLGRISGKLLTANLLRNGVDLAFNNDLLYLKVSPTANEDPNYGKPGSTSSPLTGIGINTDVPIYDFDVNSDIKTTDLTIDTQVAVGNIRIDSPNTFTTSVGGIDVFVSGTEILHDRLTTSNLILNENIISSISNSDIIIAPNKTGLDTLLHGKLEILADTYVTGNVLVTGNINITGDLTAQGTLTIGDNTYNTVTVNTDFTQDIILGDNELYTLGTPSKRWDRLYATDWTAIGTSGVGIVASEIIISDQLKFNGVAKSITTLQSNDDVFLNGSSGTTYLENIAWNADNISNSLNSPLLLSSTGTGYYSFSGTNGLVVPYGTTAERPVSAELGETRWNTDEKYLECFDGTVWNVSTGGGVEVTPELMDDIGHAWILALG